MSLAIKSSRLMSDALHTIIHKVSSFTGRPKLVSNMSNHSQTVFK